MLKKIKFWDLIRNRDGKISNSGTIGFFICAFGILAFLCGLVGWFIGIDGFEQILESTILFTGIGGALLGVRKLKRDSYPENEENYENQ